MTRAKSGNSNRGKPVNLPDWFLAAVNRLCGNRSRVEITDELNAVARREPPWRVESVYDYLAGKVTTDVMTDAFVLLFPQLPPPIFLTRSEEEARRFLELVRLYSPGKPEPEPPVTETIEDTGDRAKPREKRRETTREKTGSRRRAGR